MGEIMNHNHAINRISNTTSDISNNIRIFAVDHADLPQYADAIWDILQAADGDFVPPLSSRNSTTQTALKGSLAKDTGPRTYYEQMLQQQFILAEKNGEIIGFLSYIPDHDTDTTYGKAEYLSTIVIREKDRKSGLAKQMYLCFIAQSSGKNIVTRTWSTNISHISLLSRLSFTEIKRLKDDRGEGIDTVYYGRKCHG